MALTGSAQPAQPQQQPSVGNQTTKAVEKARQQRAPVTATLPDSNRHGLQNKQEANGEAGGSDPSPWYDLWAQSLMALWALLQLILSGVGIWYIRRTLLETEKAVREASDATDAARSAVTETSRIGEAQVRAYLSVIGIKFSAEDDDGVFNLRPPRIELVLNNSGATPANHVAYFCGAECMTIGESGAFTCPEQLRFVTMLPTLPANSTDCRDAMAFAYLPERKQYENRRDAFTSDTPIGQLAIVVIWVSVIYDDVFGRTYRSDAAFACEPRDGMKDESLRVLDTPQRSFQPIASRRALMVD